MNLSPELQPVPSVDWAREFASFKDDPYLAAKYDRERRLRQKLEYLRTWSPELANGPPGVVADIGPGPGEYMEWLRFFRCDVLGVEAPSGKGGMGEGYWRLSQLMHERQGLPVVYFGWTRFWKGLVHQRGRYVCFNFQGSWAQSHAEFLEGPQHDEHHDAGLQRWAFSRHLRQTWEAEFRAMAHALAPGGCIVVVANKTGDEACQKQYIDWMAQVAKNAGLALVTHSELGFKWRKQ